MIAPPKKNGLKQILTDRNVWDDQPPGHPSGSIKPIDFGQKVAKVLKKLVHDHPGSSLLVALTLGGLAGWFIKRRI